MMTSSTVSASRPARRKLSCTTGTPRSAAAQSFSAPPNLPIGVRTEAAKKTSLISTCLSKLVLYDCLLCITGQGAGAIGLVGGFLPQAGDDFINRELVA